MRNPLCHALSIGISSTGVALWQRRGWMRATAQQWVDDSGHDGLTPNKVATCLRSALATIPCAYLPTTLILDNAFTRLFMVTPAHNTTRLQDCRAAAAMRFQTLYGEPATHWRIQAHWDARHAFVACAIPSELDVLLRQIAHEYNLTLVAIVPHFVAAWNRWQRKLDAGNWFGLVHLNALTLGAMTHRRLCVMRTIALPHDFWRESNCLPNLLSREVLRLNLPPPSCIQLCGNIPEDGMMPSAGSITLKRVDTGTSQLSPAATLAYLGIHR